MNNKLLKLSLIFFFVILAFFIFQHLFAQPNQDNYMTIGYGERVYITKPEDIDSKRKGLIHYLWSNSGFPSSKLPNSIEKNITDFNYADLSNLKSIDKIVVEMDYGINSIAYLFHPQASINKLMVYHEGHSNSSLYEKSTIQFFLTHGYSVLAFFMPLTGMNSKPELMMPPYGRIKLISHEALRLLETDKLSPIKFFLEPIAVTLNHIKNNFNYTSINMTGISGGGWTTTLYAALDPTIAKSYPVAGSLPIYLRFNTLHDFGDYEQNAPSLYRTANYLELYIMGSYGKGRRQLQVLNRYDNCCFSGTGFKTYEQQVKKIVSSLGKGKFSVYLDETHKEHKISDAALSVILNDLSR
jgi:hypothetical protein